MKNKCFFILNIIILLNIFNSQNLQAQCNGYTELCDKKYDEVVYVTTHNAFNYEGDFIFPNHFFDVPQQLKDGVRAFMLDLYLLDGEVYLYHSFDFLGTQLFTDLLGDIHQFMVDKPNEVITFILESYISAEDVNNALIASDLIQFVHTQKKGEPWPTLQEMIKGNKRLVILSSENDGADFDLDWHHYVWDFAVETDWNNKRRSDFSCDFNRGNADNSLFILNHFITEELIGTGLPDTAELINSNPYLLERCLECQEISGKIPNFLTVDFYSLGDVFEAANNLNKIGMISLPVELLTFSITETPHQEVVLHWSTASEFKNNYFVIERSVNEQDFSAIGQVNGHFFSDDTKNYSFIDKTPFSNNNYYRLKMVNLDGQSSYSKVVHWQFSKFTSPSPSLLIAPNPLQNHNTFTLLNPSLSDVYTVNIYNAAGQLIQHIANLAGGTFPLNIAHWPKGVYWIQLTNQDGEVIDYQKVVY